MIQAYGDARNALMTFALNALALINYLLKTTLAIKNVLKDMDTMWKATAIAPLVMTIAIMIASNARRYLTAQFAILMHILLACVMKSLNIDLGIGQHKIIEHLRIALFAKILVARNTNMRTLGALSKTAKNAVEIFRFAQVAQMTCVTIAIALVEIAP